MRWLRGLLHRCAGLIAAGGGERDFDAELESHLQLHVDDKVRSGMSPDAARRDAILMLGGLAQTRERQRDRRGFPGIDSLRQDLTCAVRSLRRHPAFALTAMFTFALGIGAASAIFSVVSAVLLQPLPFRESDRLVMLYGVAGPDDRLDVVSYPTFVDWRDQARSFESAAAFTNRTVTIATGGEAELARGKQVTASFFHVLGVQPALGRAFRGDDEAAAGARIVILSDGMWRRRFGAAAGVLGTTLRVNDVPFTVVGVMPAAFRFEPTEDEQFYALQPIDPSRGHGFLRIVARLRPGVTIRQAQADLDAIAKRLTAIYARANSAPASNVMPLVDALAGPSRAGLLILLAAVTLLLLIACTNVASLLLARGATRQREFAVRAALGAGRIRLARQLLSESVLLALGGGAAGLLLSNWLARLLVLVVGDTLPVPRLDTAHTDGRVLMFTLAISLVTGVLFGVAPAFLSSSPDLHESLRDAGRAATGVRGPRVRRALVVIETALALVLLAGAGVTMRALITMRSTDPGFDTRNMLAVDLWLPPARFPALADRAPFFQAALERLRALPGVESAAFVADLPLNGATDTLGFRIVGRPNPAPAGYFSSGFNVATPGYFQTMGIPVRGGRGFLDTDGPDSPGVVVVNEAAARRFWPDQSPIGEQIQLPAAGQKVALLTVVGVTADVRHTGLARPPRPEIFVSSLQSPIDWPSLVLAVRTKAAATMLADPVRAALREVNPNVPVHRVSTMDDVIARSMAQPRLYSLLFGAFALAAVTLAAVGVYGLVAYSVTQRSQEMGIRVALGASRAQITQLVLRQGVALASVGAVLGIGGGLVAARALQGLMEGLEPADPLTFIAVTAVLFGAALVASYLPARRAARMDPLATLRAE